MTVETYFPCLSPKPYTLNPKPYTLNSLKCVSTVCNNLWASNSLFLGMCKQEHLTVESKLTVLTKVQEWFEQFCLQHISHQYWSEKQLYELNLALAEGFTNAVRHAHHELPPETKIDIELRLWTNIFEIRIWDYGKPFNPDVLEEPVPGTLREGGYGWFLLRRLADKVIYQRCRDDRNCLLIVKYCL